MRKPLVSQLSADCVLAWVATLLLHLVLLWLVRNTPSDSPRPPYQAIQPYRAIQVVLVEPSSQETPPPPTRSAPPPRPKGTPHDPRSRSAPMVSPPKIPAPQSEREPTLLVGRPLSTVLMAQARLQLQADATEKANTTSPAAFARRTPILPGQPGERIRMRTPLTVGLVVDSIGRAFGGPGYSTNLCQDLARQIETLAIRGDSAELRHDLEFEKNACRPSQ